MHKLKKVIYIHLGYPKTATKTLQAHFFPYLKNVDYLGKLGKLEEYKITKIKKKILLDLYHGKVNEILNYRKKFSHSLYNDIENSSALISAEGLVMNSLRFIQDTTYNCKKLISIYEVIDAIKTLFDHNLFDIKLILVTRRQIELIPSLYGQDYKYSHSKIKLINTFQKYFNHIVSDESSPISNYLNYYELVRIIEKEFSPDNILILPFEQFVENKISFLNNLASFMSTSFEDTVLKSTSIENKSDEKYKKRKYYRYTFDEILAIKKNQYCSLNFFSPSKYLFAMLEFIMQYTKNPGDLKLTDKQKNILFEKYKNSNQL